jgi:Tol biopolymer transport system component
MNKEILNQIPPDEQSLASKLDSVAEDMQLSQTFEWELENRLMEKYKTKTQPLQGWYIKIIPALGWAIVAIGAVFLLNWTMRSLSPVLQPSTAETPTPTLSFEQNVRQGNLCAGPLAVAHNFSLSLTNEDKTGFVTLDEGTTLEEVRSMAWSPDGTKLAVVGNTAGGGNIFVKDFERSRQYVLASSEVGYLRGASWSHDGNQLLMWSSQNNSSLYVVNADGNDLIERHLDTQIFDTPQFTPASDGVIFYGADSTATGLFEFKLDGSQTRLISSLVENESAFTWSPDGFFLAYFMADRTVGEALLVAQRYASGEKTVLAALPIPKGSGSSIPEAANLSWSSDGKLLVFEFGRGSSDRGIYVAHADGTELVKLADAAYAPAISADGRCLAYISNKQVFVLDLASTPFPSTPVLLADLPVGQAIADFRLDKLQWRPLRP